MAVLIDIEKRIGDFQLDIKLDAGNEVLAILGASGCGKSMTLKCIAGLERPDRGKIIVDGKTLFDSDKGINLKVQKRYAGLMFQNYALFPNMTVQENILTGTRRKYHGKERSTVHKMAESIMERFELSGLSELYPHQLSGGQQQRTALARILLSEPDILLLDEPFSALDSHLRFKMEEEVREVIRDFGKTVILVSHNRDEVFRLADRIGIMHTGHIETSGSKKEVFKNPRTKNAAILTGCKNISPIRKIDERHFLALDWNLLLESAQDIKDATYAGVRMHDVQLTDCTNNDSSGINTFTCKVEKEIENPFSYTVMLKADRTFGLEIDKVKWNSNRKDTIDIYIDPERILLLK